MTRIVSVAGVAPAVGTSTLAVGLRDWMVERGLSVDLVEEDEVLTRPVFAPMARELAVTGACTVATLTSCVTAFVDEIAESEYDVVICDALFPFIRSLHDWDIGEIVIDGFFADCSRALAAVPSTLIYVDADVYAALRHADVREPSGWLEWYLAHMIRDEPSSDQSPLDVAVGLLARERDEALRLMAHHGWDVRRLPEADLLTPDEILDRAQRELSETRQAGQK